ncbi:uncharacterized protein LOC100891701 isoform X3 [Strongylocentrotus purpuratus]|uniref:MANSC domain-containing protein n=1 Tax=Strongylocentrotus purpuratus TaxID=7668 RepID=A0A7M7PQE9_STRPU|nr:uncharacterized protein LOC100891701 isoform X3 [Strongylocentrotus purpuratus]
MQLSFCVAFAVVASVCVELAAGYLPVDGQGYDNGHVGKKGSSSSNLYTDNDRKDDPLPSCTREADYEISQNYIIRTKDSKTNGASFVAALSVRTFDVCLEQCCLKENCDTTIFVGEAYRSEDTNCFLFVCRPEGKNGENRCLFTYHLGYISSMMKALGGFQGYAPDPMTTAILDIDREGVLPVQQIETTSKPAPPLTLTPIEHTPACPDGYFECDSGQCINELYICNSVVDCDDGSDEYRCSAEDPLPAEQIDAGQNMQTDDQKLPQSLLMPPTNPPNMPNKYSGDVKPGPSLNGEADQTLADQLNDQSPLEDGDGDQSSIQDTDQGDRERELSDMKIRLEDESRGRLPQALGNLEPDEDKDQDRFPKLECHGATCYEIQSDGGKSRFGDVLDGEQADEEVERGRGDEEETLKSRPENQQKSPVDTQPRNLEREEYQTGDLRGDDAYQPPQRAKMPDYKEDADKYVYDKNTGDYRVDGNDNTHDINGRVDEMDEQKEDRGREDKYEVNNHLSDVKDRDASQQRVADYDPIDRKIVSDHDMGMKPPVDVGSPRNDPYRDEDQDRQDSPPLRGDGTKNWGFPNKPPKPRPPTQPPVRTSVSNSEPRLGPGYGYNSDYYSYYYQPYGQTQDHRSQQTQNNKWPSDRTRQDSYGGRNPQGASNHQAKNNPYRVPVHETNYDKSNRYDTNTDVYDNGRRYHKVSDIPADHRGDKLPSNDAKTRSRYNSLWNTWPYDYSSSVPDETVVVDNDLSFQNSNRNRPSYVTPSKSRPHPKGHKLNAPVPIGNDGKDVSELEAVVTVVAPPNEEVTDGKAKDAVKVNDTNVLTEEGNENTVEMVYESHGGSGMPPPSSAILPLVIGLVITVCLLLMVGCRLRYMNQRLRYGRLKTSAHDADYLINGMYL